MGCRTCLLIFLCLFFYSEIVFSQNLKTFEFLNLSLEDQLYVYFDTYRDGHTSLGYPRFASYIVGSYGTAVIPCLKEYIKDADFFWLRKNWPPRDINPNFYFGEPNDITLELVAYIWASLHMYSDPETLQPFALDKKEIQWFINEYKRRIDEYIIATRMIDRTVMASERMIGMIAAWGADNWHEQLPEFGHPYFNAGENRRGRLLKEYYEQRLGIDGLFIDFSVFEE